MPDEIVNAIDASVETPATENAEVTEETQEEAPAEGELQKAAEEALAKDDKSKKEVKAEKAKAKKKLKLKVDGKDFEEEFDPDDDEYLTRQLQLAKVSQKRMSEKADLEKRVQSFIEDLRKNPRKVLSDPDLGVDLKGLVESYLDEQIENSKKSPEQMEKEALEKKLNELQEERNKEKEEFKKKEFERLQNQAMEQYDLQVSQALEKSDLPKSPYVIKKIADYMLLGLNDGLDVTAADVLPLVREEIQKDIKEMFSVMPDEVIENLVGKDVFTRVRKKTVAKAKTTPPQPITKAIQDTGSKAPEKEKTSKKQSFRSYFGV